MIAEQTETCVACDDYLEVTHLDWLWWHTKVLINQHRGYSFRTAQLLAGPMPDCEQFVKCPLCS